MAPKDAELVPSVKEDGEEAAEVESSDELTMAVVINYVKTIAPKLAATMEMQKLEKKYKVPVTFVTLQDVVEAFDQKKQEVKLEEQEVKLEMEDVNSKKETITTDAGSEVSKKEKRRAAEKNKREESRKAAVKARRFTPEDDKLLKAAMADGKMDYKMMAGKLKRTHGSVFCRMRILKRSIGVKNKSKSNKKKSWSKKAEFLAEKKKKKVESQETK